MTTQAERRASTNVVRCKEAGDRDVGRETKKVSVTGEGCKGGQVAEEESTLKSGETCPRAQPCSRNHNFIL